MASGTAVRVLLALLCAGLGGAGLWRASRINPDGSSPSAKYLRTICVAGCVWYSAAWLVIAAIRFKYPYELEWIGGELHDHCMRVLNSQPLYVPPSSSWFPYEYQPVYFWVCAILMKLTHNETYEPMRMVSIVSTILSAAILFAWTRSLILRSLFVRDRTVAAGIVWPALAVGILFAGYRFSSAWFDTEHLDMLFTLFLLAGGYLLQCAEDARTSSSAPGKKQKIWQLTPFEFTLLAGIVFELAFFTKQQGAIFILACGAALAWRRSKANLAAFAAVTCGMSATGIYVLNHATHGWYGYYCFRVPFSNGIKLNLAANFFLADMPLYAPAIAVIGLAILYRMRAATREGSSGTASTDEGHIFSSDAVFAAMLIAALAAGLLSRAHWGGAENVLIAAYILLGEGAAVAAGRWEIRNRGAAKWLYMLCAAQLVVLAYRPDLQVPHRSNFAAGAAYHALIDSLQREGEVLCIDHGGFTTPAHFQIMALMDVIGAEKRLPQPVQAGLDVHRYAAIVTDAPPEKSGPLSALAKAYPNVTRIGITDTWVVTGFPTPSKLRPVYVMRR